MNNVKTIILCSFISFLLGGSCLFFIQQRRYKNAYSELESRYSLIEESNTVLRGANRELIDSNKRLGELQSRNDEYIKLGQDIIRDFKSGVGDSYKTLDRIERGFETLERLIDLIGESSEDMENN